MTEAKTSNLNDMIEKIDEYKKRYRRDDLPEIGEIKRYDLFRNNTKSENEHGWPKKFHDFDMPGIYAMLDENDQLLYIGKASMNNLLGYRLGSYFSYDPDRGCKLRHTWIRKPRYIITVSVDNNMSFEAAALEEYLISNLRTLENKNGIKK